MAEYLRHLPLAAAFVLGACAATAAQSSASTPDSDVTPPASHSISPLVTTAEEVEHRIAPSGKARVSMLARGHNAFIARIEMEPGAAVPEHRDATEEYIHVLEGSGTIVIDDQEFSIAPGSTVYMPANAKVSFQNGDVPMVGLQVFAGPEPAAKYDAWSVSPAH